MTILLHCSEQLCTTLSHLSYDVNYHLHFFNITQVAF